MALPRALVRAASVCRAPATATTRSYCAAAARAGFIPQGYVGSRACGGHQSHLLRHASPAAAAWAPLLRAAPFSSTAAAGADAGAAGPAGAAGGGGGGSVPYAYAGDGSASNPTPAPERKERRVLRRSRGDDSDDGFRGGGRDGPPMMTAEQLFDKPAWSKSAFGAGSNVKIHALTNHVMRDGKKGQAEKIVRDMTQTIQRLTGEDPALVIETAFEKCTPLMDTRTSKRGNRRFEIPMGLGAARAHGLACKWLVAAARKTSRAQPSSMGVRLAQEVMKAAQGKGSAVGKRTATHKRVEQNRAFANYRW